MTLRRTAPGRTKGLRVNPETVRAFLDRGRQGIARNTPLGRRSSGLRRSDGPKRSGGPTRRPRRPRPPEGPLTFRAWAREVYRRAAGRCEVTGVLIARPNPANFHHVVPRQALRQRGLYHRCNEPDNGILITERVHAQHEAAAERIPRDRLPERALRFARELGPWAEELIDRNYPAPGGSRDTRARRT